MEITDIYSALVTHYSQFQVKHKAWRLYQVRNKFSKYVFVPACFFPEWVLLAGSVKTQHVLVFIVVMKWIEAERFWDCI